MKRISRPPLSYSSFASVATVSLLAAALLISSNSAKAAATQEHAVGWGGTSLWIGYSGTVGYVTIDGGTQRAVETGVVSLGYAAADTATINVTGRDGNGIASQWTIRTLSGGPGKAFINVTDYGILNAYSLNIASSSTGAVAGGIKVNSNGVLNTTTGLSFGTGTGNVDVAIESGGTLNTGGLNMGAQTATVGKVVNFTIDGEGSAANVAGFLQTYGTSNITVSNGAIGNFTTTFNYLSNNATGTTAVVIKDAGSLLSFTTALDIGRAGTATLTVADGGKLRVGTYDVNNVFTGGEIKLGSAAGTRLQIGTGGDAGHIDAAKITGVYGASSQAAVVFNHNETAYTFTNDAEQNILLSGYLDVNVVAGTTVFNSGHTYFGTTTISGGKLILDNPTDYVNPGSGNSNIVIGSGGTLQIGTGGTTGNTAGSATITNNGLLVINRGAGDFQMSQNISGTGNVVYEGAATVTRSGTSSYTGSTTLTDGTVIAQSAAALGTGGTIYFNGGTLTIGSGFFGADLSSRFSTDANQQFRLGVASGLNHTMSGNIISTGGTLTKLGTGTLILNGTNTYTGATTIHEGALKIANSAALSGTSSINVKSGATFDVTSSNGGFDLASGQTLGGSGTVNGYLTLKSGSHLTPGDSVGTLTFTSGLNLEANVNLDFELGATSDKIVVSSSTLRGNGAITVNITDAGGFGEGSYTLINATDATLSSIGATQFELGTTIAGYTYYFSQVGNTFVLNVTVVPEPATCAAILGVVVLGVVVAKRRRGAGSGNKRFS